MTNIENNTDKRSQQLFIATGLTTQSAKDDIVKQASKDFEEIINKYKDILPKNIKLEAIIKSQEEGISLNVQLIATDLTTQSAKDGIFKQASAIQKALDKDLEEFIGKYSNKTEKNTESEDWRKYVVEKSKALENQIYEAEAEISTLKSKAEEFNKLDSSGTYNKQPEESKTMKRQLFDKARVGMEVIGTASAIYGAATAAPLVAAYVIPIAILAFGIADLYDMDRKNAKNRKKISEENSTVDGQIARLQAVKEDLKEGVVNPGMLNDIAPLAQLKAKMEKVVANKDNEEHYKEGIADINYLVDSLLINLKDTEKNQLREKSYAQENNDLEKLAFESMYNDPKQEIIPKLEDEINPMYKFLNEYKQAMEEIYKNLTVNNQSEVPGSLLPCIQKTKEEIKELEKASTFQTILDNYEKEMEKAPKIWDILGLDDEARIKQEISKIQNLLTSLVSNDGTAVDTIEFKENSEKLKALQEELEAVEAAARMKREEENAMRSLVNVMNHFGNNLIAVGEGLNSSFLKNSGNVVNAFSSITDGFNLFNNNGGLDSITGMFKGGMAGSVKGLESITGALTSVSGIIAGVNVASSLVSSLSGKDKKKKIEKSNEENKQAFENSTTTLLSFVEAIKANISAINSYSSTLLGYATNNTTLSGIAKVEKNFDLYIKAMVDGTKDFGTVTGLVKSKTKYKSWFKSKSEDSYTATGISEADILKAMGITNTNIKNMDESQLNDLVERLKVTGIGDVGALRGENFVDSNFEEWKEGIYEYVGQINKLREEQDQLLRNSTLNAFEGIDVSSYKSLVQEYTQMFEDMGLNADAYKDTIEEMARNAQVLVIAMQDVRSSFIEALSSGEANDFSSSMSSYFKKILNNAAQVTYDVAYSSIDEYMTKEFEKISEKLIDMKKNGVLDFNGFWDNFNFNKILEADRITTDYEKVINDLRSQLENRGFSTSLIDSMLPATELSERIESIKSMLSSAMSEALNNNSFASFEESLGNSIYESVKESLIQAFVDSEVYKTYMNQFYNMDDIKEKLSQATSAQQGFDVMQDYLKDLEYELEKMGLNRGNAASGNSTEDNTLGNSYYQDSGIEYNITIEQHFSGVYGFDAMYDVAKQGATEAIEEWKNQGKIISTI